ncbi:MAG: peptidoglycan bridge formation glycyltransferase FemA/FemB family protein [Anaerolineae bacterium]|nr:peptidoglycan bridge formation glycyltransferase FemA/FemB family protein [Anaerolineae bacterium]
MSWRSSGAASPGWNSRLQHLPGASLLQTTQWGQLKSEFGWQALRHESGAGMAQVLFRHTPIGRLAYVPLGPVCRSPSRLPVMIEELHRLCRSRGAFALKLEPNFRHNDPAVVLLRSLGFRPAFQSVQPRSTAVVDISAGEEEALARMKPKTRYNIRLAERRGVQVRQGTADDLETFARLMEETSRRDGFGVHPPRYYRRAYELFAPEGMARLFVAEYRSEPLAAVMVFAFAGVAHYLYGASSDRHRNLMPNYALQWHALRWARECGCHHYDLWGVPDEVGQNPAAYLDVEVPTGEGLWGVWRFKRGFGVEVVRRAGAWDYVYDRLAYRAYWLAYRLRRRSSG